MHVVIFTGGEIIKSRLLDKIISQADIVVAVDSGAKTALNLGVMPEIVIGDMDSIDNVTKQKLEKKKIPFEVSPIEKDETDTELAIEWAIKKGATDIILIGGIYGDRIDHVLGNILYAAISTIPITFVNGLQKSFVKKGPFNNLRLTGNKGDLLSLIPLTEDVKGLESTNLQWELHDSTLVLGKPRGISNVFMQNEIILSWKKGILFITHTYQTA